MLTTQTNTAARVAIEPGFNWDAQDAYLFDIDGTLLRSRDRVHIDSFASSVHRVTGFEITLAGILLHGSTDTAILREAWRQAGIPADVLEERLEAILEAMRNTVAERRLELDLIRMPGVEQTLDYLAQRGALLGVATGNLEMIGWIKVEAVGLRQWFRFGGFSDHFPVRSELIGAAADKGQESLQGAEPAFASSAMTRHATSRLHARIFSSVIAVATGKYTYDELLEYQPEVCALLAG